MSQGFLGGHAMAGGGAEQGVPALRPGSLRSPALRSAPPCSNDSTKGGSKLNNPPSQRTPLGDIVRESGCPLTAGIWVSLDTKHGDREVGVLSVLEPRDGHKRTIRFIGALTPLG